MTGVSTHRDILAAKPGERPTYIAANMRDHLSGWSARIAEQPEGEGQVVLISAGEQGTARVMAAEALAVAAPLVWKLVDAGHSVEDITVRGEDDHARTAISAWR